MDISLIRKKLSELENTSSKKTNLWKPKPGKTQIRIVPYLHNKDYPFVELYFHYGFGVKKKNLLSPSSYGNPDPIAEASQKLKSTGVKEDWILGKKLEPKLRTFAPILVRGEESEGVKFWGFGKETYQQLLSYMDDPDYGDITDLKQGRDITVEFVSPKDAGNQYGQLKIMIKPNTSPAAGDKSVLELIKDQKNLKDLYLEPSYSDLETELQLWMDQPAGSNDSSPASGDVDDAPSVSTTKGTKDIDAALDSLFK